MVTSPHARLRAGAKVVVEAIETFFLVFNVGAAVVTLSPLLQAAPIDEIGGGESGVLAQSSQRCAVVECLVWAAQRLTVTQPTTPQARGIMASMPKSVFNIVVPQSCRSEKILPI